MAAREPPRRAIAASRERRAMIAAEAARILATHGGGDHAGARRKAAARLGVDDPRDLPGQDEIEAALREHQRIFRATQQPQSLAALRAAAIEALRFFARFEPRLVGPVLDGTADAGSPVWLHLHVDDSAEVVRFLADQRIPIDEHGRRLPAPRPSPCQRGARPRPRRGARRRPGRERRPRGRPRW